MASIKICKKGFTPKNSCRNFKGFTLIEVIIVIIILGILTAIGIATYTASIEQQRGEACINNMRTIFTAWRIYNMNEATDYDPGAFRNISTINNMLGTLLEEKNFGSRSLSNNFGFFMDYTNTPSYYLSTYRQSGQYGGQYIDCYYYPNGNANIYYDWGGNWPWIPDDE